MKKQRIIILNTENDDPLNRSHSDLLANQVRRRKRFKRVMVVGFIVSASFGWGLAEFIRAHL
jgi:hypothetical protein